MFPNTKNLCTFPDRLGFFRDVMLLPAFVTASLAYFWKYGPVMWAFWTFPGI